MRFGGPCGPSSSPFQESRTSRFGESAIASCESRSIFAGFVSLASPEEGALPGACGIGVPVAETPGDDGAAVPGGPAKGAELPGVRRRIVLAFAVGLLGTVLAAALRPVGAEPVAAWMMVTVALSTGILSAWSP